MTEFIKISKQRAVETVIRNLNGFRGFFFTDRLEGPHKAQKLALQALDPDTATEHDYERITGETIDESELCEHCHEKIIEGIEIGDEPWGDDPTYKTFYLCAKCLRGALTALAGEPVPPLTVTEEEAKPEVPEHAGQSFKLFVVGERSGNPDDWSEWGGRAIAIASSPEEAAELVGDLQDDRLISELDMTTPRLLVNFHSPSPTV